MTSDLLLYGRRLCFVIVILAIALLVLPLTFNANSNNYATEQPLSAATVQGNVDPPTIRQQQEPINLTRSFEGHCCPQISASGNHVYTAWYDTFSIFFRKSDDNGASFNDVISFDATVRGEFRLASSTDNNNVYLVWVAEDSQDPTTDDPDIFFKGSIDGGNTFGETINLSKEIGGESTLPHIASSDDNVYVIWLDEPSSISNYDIFFRRSTDGGMTFEETVNVSNSTLESDVPTLATSNNGTNVYITWGDGNDPNTIPSNDIFFSRSTDGGMTFEEEVNLSDSPNDHESNPLVVAPENDSNVYIMWQNINFVMRASADSDGSFAPQSVLVDNIVSAYFYPKIFSLDDELYVAWNDYMGDAFFRKSDDGGVSFTEPINLSNKITQSSIIAGIQVVDNASGNASTNVMDNITFSLPNSSNNSKTIMTTWVGTTQDNNHVFVSASTDGGSTFTEPLQISENMPFRPDMAMDASDDNNNYFYILWASGDTIFFKALKVLDIDDGGNP